MRSPIRRLRRPPSRLAGNMVLHTRRPPCRLAGNAIRLPLAALLGAAATVLVACGSTGKGLIPALNAGPLQGDFEAVAQAAQSGSGNCAATQEAIAKTEQDFLTLPPTVDRGLHERLRVGIANLSARARALCTQPVPSATVTNSTPTTTSSTTTSTTPTTSTTTSGTSSTQSASTSTTTPTTTTPAPGGGTPAPGEAGGTPGSGSGNGEGSGVGAGGAGAGNGNGQGSGQ